jgi:putative redox protein
VDAHFRGHTLLTDQPESEGGNASAPMPFELFLASIGTCAGIYNIFGYAANVACPPLKFV